MKILIDEQLPTKLKYRFANSLHEVFTVRDMNWMGTKNGDLLKLMLQNGFSVLITNDKNLYYQQRISGLGISIININTKTNRYDDVLATITHINDTLTTIESSDSNTSNNYYIIYP